MSKSYIHQKPIDCYLKCLIDRYNKFKPVNMSTLQFACMCYDEHVAIKLLDSYPSQHYYNRINFKSTQANTALISSVTRQFNTLTLRLIYYKCNVTIKNKNNDSFFDLTFKHKQYNCLKYYYSKQLQS